MDRSRKATRVGNETTLQHVSPHEAAAQAGLMDDNLARLQASLRTLQETPEGCAEFARRVSLYGECPRTADETTAEFYDKLRRWTAFELPPAKAPLHPPRQVPPRENDA